MWSPHQKSGANTLFLLFFFSFLSFFLQFVRFFLLFYVFFFLYSFLFSFFLSSSPEFLCSQLLLFLFLAFSFFLSTPIWVVICVYGFYLFIYLEFGSFMGEFVVVLKVLVVWVDLLWWMSLDGFGFFVICEVVDGKQWW